jgi:hypothetical protein
MHVRVLGAEGAGGAAEELGKEAAVTAHAAHGRTRRLMRPAASASAVARCRRYVGSAPARAHAQ